MNQQLTTVIDTLIAAGWDRHSAETHAPQVLEAVHRNQQTPSRHGTYGGYLRHRRLDEPACDPCREAKRLYVANWRTRR